MHSLSILLIQASTTATTAAKSSSKGSNAPLLIVVGLIAVAYFVFLRPRNRKMRAQQVTARQLSVGDPVVTAGGIFGTVVALDAEVVEVEVAPNTVMTFLRRSVNPRPATAPTASTAAEEAPDDDWGYPAESADDDAAGDSDSPEAGSTDTADGSEPDEKSS